MINRTTRLRWRRRFRSRRRQVEGIGSQAEERLERHFFRRLSRLVGIRRFLVSWILLVVLLFGGVVAEARKLGEFYLFSTPVSGGTFVEGILGNFTNANPLYAVTSVDSSVSRLIFAGLFKYDQNHHLVGDLAESWVADERGVNYTVKLKKNLVWQDGLPLSSADVVFTYKSIQNPDAKSPLAPSWRGVTVSAVDDRTVLFTLPNALSAFPYSMTNGIVPKHLLGGITATQLRSISFNTSNPVGSGPFKWDAVEVSGDTPESREQQIAMVPNETYNGGKPKLSKFVIRSFHDEKNMTQSFEDQELTGVVGLTSTPDSMKSDPKISEYSIPLLSEVMVFLRTSHEILSDVKVRQALTEATDQNKIIKALGYPVVKANGPLLSSHIGYDAALVQLPSNPAAANKLLDEAGWPMGPNGIRQKAGKNLTFTLYSQSNKEYTTVVEELKKQWKEVGVDAEVNLQPENELQTTIALHSYDSLVFGINLGADPDVFAYWHSSQADVRLQSRLNFSEYKSTVADKSLEAGRTRSDPGIRAVKYRPFLEAWRNEAPGIALYQPRFLYLAHGTIFGFEPHSMVSGTDRYANVENWMIHETKMPK